MAFNSFTCTFVFDKVVDTKSQRYDVYSCINHFYIILFCCRVFGKFGYGFGLPKNSPFTHQFSVKILELRQNGFVNLLAKRWFHGVCEKISQESGGTSVLNKTEVTENSSYINETKLFINIVLSDIYCSFSQPPPPPSCPLILPHSACILSPSCHVLKSSFYSGLVSDLAFDWQ